MKAKIRERREILMFKHERYPTMNHVRHMLREARKSMRYMRPLPKDKRFLMKLRTVKCRKGI